MILDAFLQFTGGVGGTGVPANRADAPTTGSQVSSNVIDFGIGIAGNPAIPSPANGGGARDMGVGDPSIKMMIQVATTFVGGTSLQIGLQGAPDNGSGAPGVFTTWWLSPAYTLAQLVAGARLYDMDFPRPPQGQVVPRFVQLSYISVGTWNGAGQIQGFIVLDRDDQMYNSTSNAIQGGYQAGINVAN